MTKFKTFLSSHTHALQSTTTANIPGESLELITESGTDHRNYSRWESGIDHRAWNWSQSLELITEPGTDHSNHSRWVWNCHLCWQTQPSPQTENQHLSPKSLGQHHDVSGNISHHWILAPFALKTTKYTESSQWPMTCWQSGCSLTNRQKTIECLHYKPLRAQKSLSDRQSWGVQSLPALLGSVVTGETETRWTSGATARGSGTGRKESNQLKWCVNTEFLLETRPTPAATTTPAPSHRESLQMHNQTAETPTLLHHQQQQLLLWPTKAQLTQPVWIQPREDVRLKNQTLGFRSKSAFFFFFFF